MQTQTVHLAIYDGLADWEVGYLTAAINDPQWQREPGRFQVRTVGLDDNAVRTMGGLRVVPDLWIDELDPAASAALILPGAASWDRGGAETAAWTAAAREFLRAGTPVAAICGATLGLAAAGLLDDRQHTSAAAEYLAFAPGYHGQAHYREADAVRDRGLITAGPTDPVAFAREILAELGAMEPAVLDAWAGLYSTHDPRYFFQLMALQPQAVAA